MHSSLLHIRDAKKREVYDIVYEGSDEEIVLNRSEKWKVQGRWDVSA